MKKILVALTMFAAFVGSAVALDLQVGADVVFPMQIAKNELLSKTQTQTNVGIDLNADYFFTDLIGVGTDISFVLPLKAHCNGTATKINADGQKVFYLDFFLGPAFRVLNKDKMQLIVTPGFDMMYTNIKISTASSTMKMSSMSFSVGADAKFAYKFTDKFAANAGLYAGYTFNNRLKSGNTTTSSNPKIFVLTPKIGATYFF